MNFSVSLGFLIGFGISGSMVAALLTKLRSETKRRLFFLSILCEYLAAGLL